MKNTKLAQLNFADLLVYRDGPPRARVDYDPPLTCTRFCDSCERTAKVPKDGSVRLKFISHAADTSDYEELFGASLPLPDEHIAAPIMFLLESPGGDHDYALPVTHEETGMVKWCPTKTYFWAFDPKRIPAWPEGADSLSRKYDRFGGYFAYLMNRFHLANVYITNAIKCNLWRNTDPGRFVPNRGIDEVQVNVRDNCVKEYLSKEIAEFNPRAIFAFGKPTYDAYGAAESRNLVNRVRIEYLCHPSARRSFASIVKSNDQRIRDVLREAGLL